MGASPARIVLRHIAPLCLPSVVVRVTLNMASVILTAAALGFLGLGAQPPTPEWGAMVSTGRRFMLDSWWVVTIPGIAILVVSLAFNLVGDALRDALDPGRASLQGQGCQADMTRRLGQARCLYIPEELRFSCRTTEKYCRGTRMSPGTSQDDFARRRGTALGRPGERRVAAEHAGDRHGPQRGPVARPGRDQRAHAVRGGLQPLRQSRPARRGRHADPAAHAGREAGPSRPTRRRSR